MVQTTHLSDQKRDHMQLSHTARDAQSTTRRRKITQVISQTNKVIHQWLLLIETIEPTRGSFQVFNTSTIEPQPPCSYLRR